MKTKLVALALLGVLALPLTAMADGDWVYLFDGKTLDGWIQKNGTAKYTVEGNTIMGTTSKGSPNSFLCTKKEYANFELEFDVRLNDNELNSGVQIRSKTKPPKDGEKFGRVNGPQVEIEATLKDGAQSGLIYGEAVGGGWMSKDAEAQRLKAFKDGMWNHYRVVAKGPRIQTWINDVPIEDLTDVEHYKMYPKGFIGLQVHAVGDRGPFSVQWRNIKLKELK